MGWMTAPGCNNVSTKDLRISTSFVTPLVKMDLSQFKDFADGKYRVVLTAYDSNDEAISETTTSGELIYRQYLKGDVNSDGIVDLNDYSDLAKYFSEWEGYDKIVNVKAADLNNSGAPDLDDLSILAKCFSEWTDYREKYLS